METKACSKCGEEKATTEFGKDTRCLDLLRSECKSCAKAATAAWRAAHPEKAKAANAKWRAANQDKARVANAAWQKANPEKLQSCRAKWRESNPDYCAKYRAANPEAKRIIDQNRRARKRAAGGKLSSGLAVRLFDLQKGKCACCKRPLGDDYHLDHIMPIVLGGTNTDDNMQLLRAECNLQKHAKHPVAFMQQRGFLC